MYRTELHFIRIVCQPTKQQFQKISADGETVLKATVRKFAVAQHRLMRGIRGGIQRSQPTDSRKLIAEGLMKSVKTVLSAEQAARYQKELDRRAASRKRITLLNLVAHLDKNLMLSAEQRSKLSKTLDANWKDSWSQTQRLMNMDHYFPQIPDNKVLPILNETQKRVWRGIPKRGNVFVGFNIGMMGLVQVVEIEEEVWDEEQPVERQERADGKPAAKAERKAEEKK